MGNLPADLPAPPSFQTTNPNTQPIVYITMATDTLTMGDLYDYANNMVAQRMMMLEGVSNAQVYGSPRAVCIQMDANALSSRGLTVLDVANAVSKANVFTPGGQIYGNYLQYIINPKGQLLRAEDYKDLIIRYQDSAPVRVKDVAKSVDGLQKQYFIIDFWTSWMKPRASSLVVAVTPAPGANDVLVAQAVRDTLAKLQDSLPASIEAYINYDRSRSSSAVRVSLRRPARRRLSGDRHYSHRFPQIKHGFWAIRIRENPRRSVALSHRGGQGPDYWPVKGGRPFIRSPASMPFLKNHPRSISSA
jgi:multidrug efflux pump subunit AcrB